MHKNIPCLGFLPALLSFYYVRVYIGLALEKIRVLFA
jgi:hypothetical protein